MDNILRGMIERIGISVEKELLQSFDAWMRLHGYTNRSEAVRDLMRSTLLEKDWETGTGNAAAVLVLVYEHHFGDLAHQMDHLQHDHNELVVATFHVHLDHENCLEVVMLRGKAEEVKGFGQKLTALRGVKYGRLVPAATTGLLGRAEDGKGAATGVEEEVR
ncbi:MAG: nickel-responsive transcriptional regulator NikR [Planctomycetes bacterium]|nr:nickel-responsive transcriptional regulator NikR [Planctomycetota bacterium]